VAPSLELPGRDRVSRRAPQRRCRLTILGRSAAPSALRAWLRCQPVVAAQLVQKGGVTGLVGPRLSASRSSSSQPCARSNVNPHPEGLARSRSRTRLAPYARILQVRQRRALCAHFS
jgi:hypothetical protein